MHVCNFPSTHWGAPTEIHIRPFLTPHPTCVTCTVSEIFTSIHKTAALPPAATEHFSFPLKEMRRKGDILGGGNTGKRSVAKLACLSDSCRVRIGNKRKKWWENLRLQERTKTGGRSPDEETERPGCFSMKEEGNKTSYGKDVRLWQRRCRWPSWTILGTLIGRTVRTRTTRTFLCCALRIIPSGWSRFLQRQKNFKDSPISSFGSLSLHSCQNVWKRPCLFFIPQVSHVCSFKNRADSEA